MSVEYHDGKSLPSGDGYTAFCSCGWSSQEMETMEAAEEAWDHHCDAVFMEATGG